MLLLVELADGTNVDWRAGQIERVGAWAHAVLMTIGGTAREPYAIVERYLDQLENEDRAGQPDPGEAEAIDALTDLIALPESGPLILDFARAIVEQMLLQCRGRRPTGVHSLDTDDDATDIYTRTRPDQPERTRLEHTVRLMANLANNEADFILLATEMAGMKLHPHLDATGVIECGYSLADHPGIYYDGGTLAPDLNLHSVRLSWTGAASTAAALTTWRTVAGF
ncbi:hypothetical protein [Nocardia panacis]|nr:hypothetical protein [Nocardia panacis]